MEVIIPIIIIDASNFLTAHEVDIKIMVLESKTTVIILFFFGSVYVYLMNPILTLHLMKEEMGLFFFGPA